MIPLLPKLTSFKLSRFEPLFTKDISSPIPHDLFIIAGGNGLGKTTIMQAIIYCIAGEMDITIEQEKSKRWDLNYFYGKLNDHAIASIETGFSIGKHKVIIQRGFKSKLISKLLIDGEESSNLRELDSSYKNFIEQDCGYKSFDDFRFIVHKLCYLPETRPDLVWNLDTQIRILMTIFSDIIDESRFREQRDDLKQLDSTRRHINVAINHTKAEIKKRSIEEKDDEKEDVTEEVETLRMDDTEIEEATKQLSEIYKERLRVNKELKIAANELSIVSSDVEKLEEELSKARESFLLSKLSGFEKHETRMAIHKLLFLKLCPACGNKASELSQSAEILVQKSCCPLCGADEHLDTEINLPQLDAELKEKIVFQLEYEKRVLKLEEMLNYINKQENILQVKVDKIRLRKPVVSSLYSTPQKEKDVLKLDLKNLERQYAEIDNRFIKLQDWLDKEYNAFYKTATLRLERLRQIYKKYATSFLGVTCDLEETESGDKFLNLNLFVPSFNDHIRTRPDMCSEAQRFFLDIAFRLALIDLAAQLSKSSASFICETPENSLDISYIENVSTMFRTFAEKRHTILITTNIQPGGLARPILRGKSIREKKKSILNLLEYGHLSDVQEKNISKLNEEFKAIISSR